jgi:hypothetical protein
MYANTQPGIGDQLYSGAAEVGKIRTTISLVVAVIIGVIFLIIGISLLFKKNVHTFTVSALIDSANCSQMTRVTNNTASTTYNCDLKISYMYKGTRYPSEPAFFSLNAPLSDRQYVKGNSIDVYIDPNDPQNFSLESLQSDKFIGWICIGFAVLIVGMAYLMRWLSQRYKFFAAAQGAGLGVNIIGGGFRGGNMF